MKGRYLRMGIFVNSGKQDNHGSKGNRGKRGKQGKEGKLCS
jgi:hypothetical protein